MSAGLAEIVQQIVVKIACAGSFEGFLKLPDRVFARFAIDPCRVFGGKLEAVSRIPLHERSADRFFRTVICPCRVKIRKSVRHKAIHHVLYLFDVDLTILFRQTHHSEAEFFDFLIEEFHMIHSLRIRMTSSHGLILSIPTDRVNCLHGKRIVRTCFL